MFIVVVYERLHLLGHLGCDKPFDCCFLLCPQSFLLFIVMLPFGCEEVGKVAQPLVLLLDFLLPFTEVTQPLDIHCDSYISHGLYGLGHHIVHFKALFQQK